MEIKDQKGKMMKVEKMDEPFNAQKEIIALKGRVSEQTYIIGEMKRALQTCVAELDKIQKDSMAARLANNAIEKAGK